MREVTIEDFCLLIATLLNAVVQLVPSRSAEERGPLWKLEGDPPCSSAVPIPIPGLASSSSSSAAALSLVPPPVLSVPSAAPVALAPAAAAAATTAAAAVAVTVLVLRRAEKKKEIVKQKLRLDLFFLRFCPTLWLAVRRSPLSAARRIASWSCRRRAWLGIAGGEGILPGRPSSGCRTCPGGRCRWHRPYKGLHRGRKIRRPLDNSSKK